MTSNDGHVYDEKFQYCTTCGREAEICPCCGDQFPPHDLFEAPEGEPAYVYCTPCWEMLFAHGGSPSGRAMMPKGLLNSAQEARLRLLCKRYNVAFNPRHYHPATLQGAGMMFGWVEGWVGGEPGTIFVGVSPAGESHS